jgi:hypothetical protein
MDTGAAISIDDVDIGYGGAPVQSGIRVEIDAARSSPSSATAAPARARS